MVTSKAKTVDDYLERSDPKARPALEAFRKLIKRAVPRAKESMTYGMPTYALESPFVAFNAQKNYLSFYVCAVDVVAERKKDLGGLDCGKSCLRASRLESFPLDVLAELTAESAKRCGTTKRVPAKKAARKVAAKKK